MTGGAADSRTIVITGASDGIGACAARTLAARGHHVVVVGRSAAKTEDVAREFGAPWYLVDFAHLDSVRELAERLRTDVGRIDVLVNNAGGVFGPDRIETQDGHEITFQVDYLAPFLLTNLLLDRLVEARGGVISTSSVANRLLGHVDIDDLDARAGTFNARRAYGTAKLEQILFTKELDRRYRAQHLSSAAFHPGVIASSFASSRGSALGWIYQNPLSRRFLGSPDSGPTRSYGSSRTCLAADAHLGATSPGESPSAPPGRLRTASWRSACGTAPQRCSSCRQYPLKRTIKRGSPNETRRHRRQRRHGHAHRQPCPRARA